jgi:hypothetical protein
VETGCGATNAKSSVTALTVSPLLPVPRKPEPLDRLSVSASSVVLLPVVGSVTLLSCVKPNVSVPVSARVLPMLNEPVMLGKYALTCCVPPADELSHSPAGFCRPTGNCASTALSGGVSVCAVSVSEVAPCVTWKYRPSLRSSRPLTALKLPCTLPYVSTVNASPLVGVKPFCTDSVIVPASEAKPVTLIWSYAPGVVPPRLIARLLDGVCVIVVTVDCDWMCAVRRLTVVLSALAFAASVFASTYDCTLAAGATGVLAGAAATGVVT